MLGCAVENPGPAIGFAGAHERLVWGAANIIWGDRVTETQTEAGVPQWHPSQADISAFTDLVLRGADNAVNAAFIRHADADGASISSLFLELLSGSARMLGERWESDECSFVDVTLGLATLHTLLHRYGERLEEEVEPVMDDRAILITPIPGEDHIFAASVVLQFFRSARWRAYSGIGESREAILRSVEDDPPDVIGVAVSAGDKLSDCLDFVGELRSRCPNKAMKVLVGGPPFLEQPSAYRTVGADATAQDAVTALAVAASLVDDAGAGTST